MLAASWVPCNFFVYVAVMAVTIWQFHTVWLQEWLLFPLKKRMETMRTHPDDEPIRLSCFRSGRPGWSGPAPGREVFADRRNRI